MCVVSMLSCLSQSAITEMSTPDCSNDKSPDAYEKVVDRLLASPRYGERMASRWMDSARYADFNKSDRAHHDQNDGRKDETIGFKDGSPRYVESPLGRGVAFDGKLYFDAGRRADFRYKSLTTDYRERFTIAAWVYPESEQSGSIIT